MNWDAIGAIGEIVGATAVVLSLLYLALQLRQSTNFARMEYHTKTIDSMAPSYHWRAANPHNARIFREGLQDFRTLNADERVMLDSVLSTIVLSFKDILEARKNNLLDSDTYKAWEGYVGALISMPGGTLWWEQIKPGYTDEVQRAVASVIEKVVPYDQLMPIVFGTEAREVIPDDS
ncbi:MAG: hypothetical protein DRR06_07295 [Gammaproteobacteria bacterium]|nr:MAG: hypothetical protein DRR42_23160 [Gammaproteobacteria bacterium]RLA45451.1 MAG: hypothetical protein DRR06_07295 [Gammaproteobacteria bacterium]